jgi:hypothetical protein
MGVRAPPVIGRAAGFDCPAECGFTGPGELPDNRSYQLRDL